MPLVRTLSRCLLAILIIGAGIMHFVNPAFFVKIVPPYLPWPLGLVYLSGVCEIALGGLLLVSKTSRIAAWGLIALFVAVFPANIYVYQHQELIPASPLMHILRLPLQALLILWAYVYTRPDSSRKP